jgi:2-keto-3-deoxy-L-rhamnonate aldolase RhmA
MTRQHHTSFAQSIFGSAQRLFSSNKHHGLLAPAHIDARTARDIGINLVGLR